MSKGFVYILSNSAMPGLIKIGFTTKIPTERAAELDTTGVPQSFVVEYYCIVDEPAELEAQAHRELHLSRHTTSREFFRADVAAAIFAIDRLAPRAEHRWYRTPPLRPRPSRVECKKCGAMYVSAVYCPKCQVKLNW